VERLAADLRAEFPDLRGFSMRSIWEMKRLSMAYSEPDFLRQPVAELKRTKKFAHSDFLQQAVAEFGSGEIQTQPAPEKLAQALAA